jgi:hypothetical protein
MGLIVWSQTGLIVQSGHSHGSLLFVTETPRPGCFDFSGRSRPSNFGHNNSSCSSRKSRSRSTSTPTPQLPEDMCTGTQMWGRPRAQYSTPMRSAKAQKARESVNVIKRPAVQYSNDIPSRSAQEVYSFSPHNVSITEHLNLLFLDPS